MPYLEKLSNERDVTVLGINFNEPVKTVQRYVDDRSITFPILMEPDDIVLLFYKARSLPMTYVIDPEGNIALKIVGQIDEERLDLWLDEMEVP